MKTMKFTSLLIAVLVIVCSLSACSKFEYDNSTIYAKVTSIDGQKVTFIVGEMNIDENMMQDGNMTPPTGDGNMPQMPNGNMGEIPELPEGETMPDMGEMPEIPSDGSVPEIPEGGMQMPGGERPEGMEGMQMPFTEGDDTMTLTLNEETVKTLSVDSIVQITFGDNGNVQSLTVIGGNMQGGFGSGQGFGDMTPPTDETTDTEASGS